MDEHCNEKISEALKELGYPTKVTFVNHFGAIEIPVNQGYIHLWDAQKWLREEKHLHIEVRWYSNLWYEYEVKEAEGKRLAEGSAFKTYEEALSTAIYMAIEYINNSIK